MLHQRSANFSHIEIVACIIWVQHILHRLKMTTSVDTKQENFIMLHCQWYICKVLIGEDSPTFIKIDLFIPWHVASMWRCWQRILVHPQLSFQLFQAQFVSLLIQFKHSLWKSFRLLYVFLWFSCKSSKTEDNE